MAKPSTKGLLKEILSDDIEWVYIHITDKAVEWSVAGHIDEANILLQQLWKFNIPHSENLRLSEEGLQVLWTMSNKQPLNIPFLFKDIVKIEQRNYDELFSIGINAGYCNSKKVENILEALKIFLQSKNAAGYRYFHAASCGALLAAKNNLNYEAEYFIKLWGEGYLKYWNNYLLAQLMRDRKCAEYLLKGLLASTLNLTQEICQSETQEIIDRLSTRMTNGRSLVYGNLSWKQLLNKISKLAIEQETIKFPESVLVKKNLLKPPASANQIDIVVQRLGIQLPADYKEFLLTSNGFECFSTTGVTLTSLDEVDFLRNYDGSYYLYCSSMDEDEMMLKYNLENTLIIGGHNEEQQLFLVPLQNGNWECWHFASWRPGEDLYQSFRYFMEKELQYLEDGFYNN